MPRIIAVVHFGFNEQVEQSFLLARCSLMWPVLVSSEPLGKI